MTVVDDAMKQRVKFIYLCLCLIKVNKLITDFLKTSRSILLFPTDFPICVYLYMYIWYILFIHSHTYIYIYGYATTVLVSEVPIYHVEIYIFNSGL